MPKMTPTFPYRDYESKNMNIVQIGCNDCHIGDPVQSYILENHKDRPSCEFSVSVHIDSSGEEWPFVVDEKEFFLEKGDALFYRGTEVFHSRPVFTGDFYLQVFLHYVNAEGPFKNNIRDGRPSLGIPKRLPIPW